MHSINNDAKLIHCGRSRKVPRVTGTDAQLMDTSQFSYHITNKSILIVIIYVMLQGTTKHLKCHLYKTPQRLF